jgi:hypothetical protein
LSQVFVIVIKTSISLNTIGTHTTHCQQQIKGIGGKKANDNDKNEWDVITMCDFPNSLKTKTSPSGKTKVHTSHPESVIASTAPHKVVNYWKNIIMMKIGVFLSCLLSVMEQRHE